MRRFLLQRLGPIFSFSPCRNNRNLPVIPIEAALTVKLATEEVNNVSILFGNRGISCRRDGFYRRSRGVGREVSRKKNGTEVVIPNLNSNSKEK